MHCLCGHRLSTVSNQMQTISCCMQKQHCAQNEVTGYTNDNAHWGFAMRRVVMPGNPGICGNVPGSLEAAQLMQTGTTVLTATSFGTCPAKSNANGPIASEANVNSSPDVLVALVPRYAVLCCAFKFNRAACLQGAL